MLAVGVLDTEPRREQAHQLGALNFLSHRGEISLVVKGLYESLQPLAVIAGAIVAQSGLFLSLLFNAIRVEGHRRYLRAPSR